MSKVDFNSLLEKYASGNLSSEELRELSLFLHSSAYEADLKSLIDEKFDEIRFRQKPSSAIAGLIFERISKIKNEASERATISIRRHRSPKRIAPWLYAAAVVLLFAGGRVLYYSFNKPVIVVPVVAGELPSANLVAPPASVKASITLSSGEIIELDSAANGRLANQGSANLIKMADGQIAYRKNDEHQPVHEIVYNTLTVPRGSRVVNITLSDGTKVWLNAASSLRYPVAFISGERRVEISGEVYFEVATLNVQNALGVWGKAPFVVRVNDKTEVNVLGTHFNIHANTDDPHTAITLLEGVVTVTHGLTTSRLKPGQQAKLTNSGTMTMAEEADIETVMAWKNGYFEFDGAGIEEVMRQVARWYDVDIVYEGAEIKQHFRGGISRNVDASKVFKMLEATDAVHFKIVDRKIIVTP